MKNEKAIQPVAHPIALWYSFSRWVTIFDMEMLNLCGPLLPFMIAKGKTCVKILLEKSSAKKKYILTIQ